MSFGVNFVNELDKKFWWSDHRNKIIQFVNHHLQKDSTSRYDYNQIDFVKVEFNCVELRCMNHRIRQGEGDGTVRTPVELSPESLIQINMLINQAVLTVQSSLKELTDKDKQILKQLEDLANNHKEATCPLLTIALLELQDELTKLKINYKNLED